MDSELKENRFPTIAFLHNKIVKNLLMPLGGWPCEVFQEKTPLISRFFRRFIPIQGMVMICGELNYIRYNYSRLNFFLLGHIYITMFLTFVMLVRAVLPNQQLYKDMVEFFYGKFDLEHFKHKGPYYQKASEMVYKISYYYGLVMTGMMICGMFLYNALPLYHNYNAGVLHKRNRVENATLEFSVYFIFPGFMPENHFWSVTFVNLYFTYSCSVEICIIDLFMALFVFHMVGHIMILLNNIENVEMPKTHYNIEGLKAQTSVTVALYNDEENEIMRSKIIEFINHHRFIVSFADDVSSLFGPVLASTYMFHLISCCLLLLECSQLVC
ncbi:unnamed protein product [Chilo suppressalis]|uniref:Odorant receptor n=1 Tax=Chilo suppressalis TaxID=168631 RepID=A0ABN8B9R8_CHISP|nr:unnamed protein product [Chilo suppressalis]